MFVAPYALPTTVRFVESVVALDDARVGLVSTDPQESFGERVMAGLAGHWRTADCTDVEQLTTAVEQFIRHFGRVDRVVTILENIVEQVAEVTARLGLPGIAPETARRFRDKSVMKEAFEAAGIPCAGAARADSADAARTAADRFGFPLVVKPPAGAGAKSTYRIESTEALDAWLAAAAPTVTEPVVIEEFVTGTEHSFDSVIIDGRPVWHSIGRYSPSPLNVVETPWIQWCVILPRDISGPPYDQFADIGYRAVEALGLVTGLTHMEWFERDDGRFAVSEVAVRPPGARFVDLMSYAHDCDMYAAWAELVVHHRFHPPQRRHAVGAAYLRAAGPGARLIDVHGLDRLSQTTRDLIVDVRLPQYGDPPRDTYEGDGTIVVRAPETAAVEAALHEVITTVRLELAR